MHVAEQVQMPLDDGTLISKSVDHTVNENEVDNFANFSLIWSQNNADNIIVYWQSFVGQYTVSSSKIYYRHRPRERCCLVFNIDLYVCSH